MSPNKAVDDVNRAMLNEFSDTQREYGKAIVAVPQELSSKEELKGDNDNEAGEEGKLTGSLVDASGSPNDSPNVIRMMTSAAAPCESSVLDFVGRDTQVKLPPSWNTIEVKVNPADDWVRVGRMSFFCSL